MEAIIMFKMFTCMQPLPSHASARTACLFARQQKNEATYLNYEQLNGG